MSSKRVIIVINATLIMCYKNNLMLKVIFKVEKLVLKLTNIECEILAKKDNLTIPLSPLLTIKNGEVLIGAQTQFLIIQNDPILLLQVSLCTKGSKKLGGELSLNIGQWEENVHHSTMTSLNKSPDKNAFICFTFLYIRKHNLTSQQTLILCSEFRDLNLTQIDGKRKQLKKKQNRLQDQIKKLREENQVLLKNQKERIEELKVKKKDHDRKIKGYQDSIDKNNVKNDYLKRKNQQIVKMIKKYGREEIITELQKKYLEKEVQMQDQKGSSKPNSSESSVTNLRSRESDPKVVSQSQSSDSVPKEQRQRSRQKNHPPRFIYEDQNDD